MAAIKTWKPKTLAELRDALDALVDLALTQEGAGSGGDIAEAIYLPDGFELTLDREFSFSGVYFGIDVTGESEARA